MSKKDDKPKKTDKPNIEDLSDDELLMVFQKGITEEIKQKKAEGHWVALYDPVKKQVYREFPDGHIEYVNCSKEGDIENGYENEDKGEMSLTGTLIDMPMPKNCEECPLNYKRFACIMNAKLDVHGEKRPEGCPLHSLEEVIKENMRR